MTWYWIAIIAGLILPWLIFGKTIRVGFEERGLLSGLGTWAGMATLTVPIMLLIMWMADKAR
jgi:hypothetical protein